MLGKPLNKSQQCSSWHERPLAPEQLLYAANDAAVLLAIFDSFVETAPPERFCVVRKKDSTDLPAHNDASGVRGVDGEPDVFDTSGGPGPPRCRATRHRVCSS